MIADPILELTGVSKVFPVRSKLTRKTVGTVRAVDGVTLQVGRGETLGLVGESGSGKSTLGRLALRLIEPTAGQIVLAGSDITHVSTSDMRSYRQQMQMVFQDPYASLDPHSTIVDCVGEPLRTHLGLRGKALESRVGDLLERVRMSRSQLDRYPHEFSGGQLQRLALARAIALGPKLIVADEPVSSLDVSTQAQILELLKELQAEMELAILFISHDLSVVQHVSSRIAVMYLGRVVEVGPVRAVTMQPQHPYSRALLAAVPYPDPVVQRTRLRVVLQGELPSPMNPPSGCRFHTRCPEVEAVCHTVDPPATTSEASGTVFCNLYSESKV